MNSNARRATPASTDRKGIGSVEVGLHPVTVWVSSYGYRTLAERAEERGYDSIPDMLLALIDQVRGDEDTLDEQLIRLHALGHHDGLIAEEMHSTRQSVGKRRRKLMLPPNPTPYR